MNTEYLHHHTYKIINRSHNEWKNEAFGVSESIQNECTNLSAEKKHKIL